MPTDRKSHVIRDGHRYGIRCLDYNPNRPKVFCTGGDDGLIKFWDLRKCGGDRTKSKPLKILLGHTHWVSVVKYNPFHDQLVLSGGSDTLANLWRVSSISSAPLLEFDDGATGTGGASDIRVAKLENPDSVYDVAWSAGDAWVFACLSYDGQVVVNHVPSKEKYKILL